MVLLPIEYDVVIGDLNDMNRILVKLNRKCDLIFQLKSESRSNCNSQKFEHKCNILEILSYKSKNVQSLVIGNLFHKVIDLGKKLNLVTINVG